MDGGTHKANDYAMDRCAPAYADQTIGCFTKDALLKIARAYNARNLDPIRVNNSQTKKEIWEAIQQKMSQKCGTDETCWLEQPGINSIKDELNEFFKPLAPLGRYQWLSTDDIYNVMKQYEIKYPRFKFIGPLPMDFLNLKDPDSKFCQSLNLDRAKSKYDNIGVILNMDASKDGGSHWIAMHIDLNRREIQFFDSYGDKHLYDNKHYLPFYDSEGKYHKENKIALPPNVQKFVFQCMLAISPDLKNTMNQKGGTNKTMVKMPYNLKVNTIQHQYANSECGVYSMLFIIKSLNDTFENITRDIIADEMANKYRDSFFRRK
jgi:hypothetical protein